MSRRPRRARTLVSFGLCAVALVACGVGSQDEPSPIPPEDVPFDLPMPPGASTTTTTSIIVVPTPPM